MELEGGRKQLWSQTDLDAIDWSLEKFLISLSYLFAKMRKI